MKLEVGKLYRCEKDYLMLYPDPDTAAAASAARLAIAPRPDVRAWPDAVHSSAVTAAYWSNRFGKTISYGEKNIPLLVLNSKENFYEVLAGDKKGWIIFKDWLKFKEIC